MITKQELGLRISWYRQLQKLSQKELAQRLKVTNSAVSNWEQGLNYPDISTLDDLCYVLDVSPNELLRFSLSSNEFSAAERRLVAAYKSHRSMQPAVNTLLGIEPRT